MAPFALYCIEPVRATDDSISSCDDGTWSGRRLTSGSAVASAGWAKSRVRGPASFWQKNKNNYLVSVKIRTSGCRTLECFIAALPAYGVCGGVRCTSAKLLTDLQILCCKLYKNAFGGRTPPGPAGGAIACYPLAVIRGGEGDEGKKKGIGNSGAARIL